MVYQCLRDDVCHHLTSNIASQGKFNSSLANSKIMGFSNGVHWVAWFINTFVMMTVKPPVATTCNKRDPPLSAHIAPI